MSKANLTSVLEAFGAPAESVLLLDEAHLAPRHLPYLDLIRVRSGNRIDGVVELDKHSVLYAVEGSPDPQVIPSLHRAVAYRADTPFLVFVEPGRLTLYDLGKRSPQRLRTVDAADHDAPFFVANIGLHPDVVSRRKYSADRLLQLLRSTTESIRTNGLSADDALSLSGRALFLRFLVDRNIVTQADLKDVCREATDYRECFQTVANVQTTSEWLDETFNGDLMPLSFGLSNLTRVLTDLSTKRQHEVLRQLCLIAHRAHPSGQLEFDWGDIDFGHVPVGLLSQVYEGHCETYQPDAKKQSIHYTPRQVAEHVVEEAFKSIPNPSAVTVLDPAAGAGVFLVAAFRRLVGLRWETTGSPPTTAQIRRILYEQLCGFDINATALRLAALSLYLTALEVDTDPRPLRKLKFRELLGSVLHDFQNEPLGSLQHGDDEAFRGRFDIVLGNPPWTVSTRTAPSGTRASLALAQGSAAPPALAGHIIPDDDPDLAFLWVATRWAKPGGRLALLMHARFLFKQSEPGQAARREVFGGLRVRSVLNGAALRHTEVWPRVDAPFCFILAENRPPSADNELFFASPLVDDGMNRLGRFRIDYSSAQPIWHKSVGEDAFLFKVLFRGSALDLPVLRRIASMGCPLAQVWKDSGLKHGQGFQIGGTARLPQSAKALAGLPMLEREDELAPIIDTARLAPVTHKKLLYPRRRDIYRAPLVLVPEAPRADPNERWAHLAFQDVAYNRSFYGFSTYGHPEAELLARYLHVVLSSDLFLYHALLTSGKFGYEREVIYEEDLERFPIIPFGSIPGNLRKSLSALSRAFCADPVKHRAAADEFVRTLYHLDKAESQIVRDTLETGLPFTRNMKLSQEGVTDAELEAFLSEFEDELRGLLDTGRVGRSSVVRMGPWIIVEVGGNGRDVLRGSIERKITEEMADQFGSSQVVVVDAGAGVVRLWMLNQRRYLTRSRGRLCALRLAEDHGTWLLHKTR
jgi:hypothetical protein